MSAFPPAIPSEGGVALTLPAALQGVARISGSRVKHWLAFDTGGRLLKKL